MNQKRFILFSFIISLSCLLCCSQAPRIKQPRVNLVWPKPPDIPRIKFINSFSSPQDLGIKTSWHQKLHMAITGKKEEKTQLVSPFNIYVIYVDGKENIYITDTFSRSLHILDRSRGKYHEIFSTGNSSFSSPIGVAVDSQQRIYVSDSILKKVFVFNEQEKCIFSIGSGRLQRPTGIAVDGGGGKLYVVDTLEHKIKIFSPDGRFLKAWGKRGLNPGEFNFPTCISIDRNHRVYVGDSMNFRIQVFDGERNLLNSFGQAGDGTGFFSQIKGVAVDSEGHIYVTDAQFDVVQVFDIRGNFLLAFGESGSNWGEFQLPCGIFIDRFDNIYVADRLNQRI